MMKTILDLINRNPNPAPWSEGDNIPWNDPGFSERMLKEHLLQDHDLASRRSKTIDTQVDWIWSEILNEKPARILDIACGPGLYMSRLARRGCKCVGIDFSPASIRHAMEIADNENLPCIYHLADVRDAIYGDGYASAMMIYGQFNVFQRDRGLEILKNVRRALEPGGILLLEVQSEAQVRRAGQNPPSWYTARTGLFSPKPHVVLQENFWDEEARAATNRFLIIDGQGGEVSSYAISNEAYSESEFADTIASAGFEDLKWFGSLTGKPFSSEQDLPVIVARKSTSLEREVK